jgi:3-hydroxybutyryl-CoA dehydratase
MSSESERTALLETWTETSSHVLESVVAANRAAFAAFGVGSTGESPDTADRLDPAADRPEWHTQLTTDDPEELSVGDRFEFTKTLTDGDVRRFAAASGDTNPLHLDEEFAEQTRFRGRIAHGTLVGGLISAALARVPGLVVYLSQDLEFHNPVRIEDRVTAECEIVEDLSNSQYRLNTQVLNNGEVAVDGEAVILIDDPPGQG